VTAASDRHLEWGGCFNARDLGGLPTSDGRTTRWGAIVRSDHLDELTPDGWRAVQAYGIRTVVDLRNDDERTAWRPPPIDRIWSEHVPLDDIDDTEFWAEWGAGWQFGTPLYYRAFLDHKADRCVSVLRAIAGARPGGVVVHCGGGRDRTGLVTMLLLTLAGVPAEVVADDYELSATRLPLLYAERGEPDQVAPIERFLADRRTTARAVILRTLREVDVGSILRKAGLDPVDVEAIVARLVERGA
jgi:hypothetical protein